MGKLTYDLEDRLSKTLGRKHTICFSSGSSAYLSALISLQLEPFEKILTANRSWINCINAHSILRLRSIICDVEERAPIIKDTKKVCDWIINNRPRVILITHINGFWSRAEKIRSAARKVGAYIIDDRAQSLGSLNELDQVDSDIQIYSIGITKLISAGQGGFAQTDNDQLAQALRLTRVHGISSPEMRDEQLILGHNSRLTDMHAALADCMLDKMHLRVQKTNSIILKYQKELSSVQEIESFRPYLGGEYGVYPEFLVKSRDDLIKYLEHKSIQATRLFVSLHYLNKRIHDFNCIGPQVNSSRLDSHGIGFPGGPDLKDEDLDYVIACIKEFYSSKSVE